MKFNMVRIMLIASGLLMSSNKKKDNKNPKLPNFIGILEVKHYILGRLRLNCPCLKNNYEGAKVLIETFNKIPGVNKVVVNECIGSILIEYDFNALEPILIMGVVLRVLGLEEQVKQPKRSLIDKETINIADSLNHAIYEKTNGILDLKSMVMILIGGYALYEIKVRPQLRPCGYTCLWWAYSSLADKI